MSMMMSRSDDDHACDLIAKSDRCELTPEDARFRDEWLARRVAIVRESHQKFPGVLEFAARDAFVDARMDCTPYFQPRVITPRESSMIRRLHNAGKSQNFIAHKIGIHYSAVARVLRSA